MKLSFRPQQQHSLARAPQAHLVPSERQQVLGEGVAMLAQMGVWACPCTPMLKGSERDGANSLALQWWPGQQCKAAPKPSTLQGLQLSQNAPRLPAHTG